MGKFFWPTVFPHRNFRTLELLQRHNPETQTVARAVTFAVFHRTRGGLLTAAFSITNASIKILRKQWPIRSASWSSRDDVIPASAPPRGKTKLKRPSGDHLRISVRRDKLAKTVLPIVPRKHSKSVFSAQKSAFFRIRLQDSVHVREELGRREERFEESLTSENVTHRTVSPQCKIGSAVRSSPG